MRAPRILFWLVTVSLLLGPLAAAAQQAGTPPEAKDKAQVEAAAAPAAPAQEAKPSPAPPAAKKPAAKAEVKRTEPIVPAYTGIKEKTAVIVFFVWLWFAIGVLIYFLRQWIKESDRIYWAKYYEPEESPRKDNPMAPTLGD